MDKSLLDKTKAMVRSLIISEKNVMTLQQLLKDYRSFTGQPLPLLGHRNAEDFLRTLPDVVEIKGSGPQAIVQCIPSKNTLHICNLVKEQKPSKNKGPRYRRTNNTQEGPVNGYANVYSFMQHQEDDDSDWNGKLEEQWRIKNEMDDNVKCERTQTKENIKQKSEIGAILNEQMEQTKVQQKRGLSRILEKVEKLKCESENEKNKSDNVIVVRDACEEAVPASAATEVLKRWFIKDKRIETDSIIRNDLIIPPWNASIEMEVGTVHPLYVSKIHSPLTFFFHLHNEKHDLLELVKEMKILYNSLGPWECSMPHEKLYAGAVCAAKCGNAWLRAKIFSVPQDVDEFSKIKLFFVDYGHVSELSVRFLKSLLPRFAHLPVQAVRGRLAHMKSVHQRALSAASTNYFSSLIQENCIYGHVTSIEENVVDLVLIDTNRTPHLQINNEIIKFLGS